MGIVFTLVLGGLAYIVIADPFNIRPIITFLLFPPTAATVPVSTESPQPAGLDTIATTTGRVVKPATVPTATSGPTPDQSAALESVGIDPRTAIDAITVTQLECFVSILGASRVAEIKAGAVPSATEFMSVRSCL